MSSEVLIFQHMKEAHPSYIELFLECRGVPFRILRGFAGDPIPSLDDSVAGLVFMGGVMSANDDLPWLLEEQRLISQALEQQRPLLGHCLGGQLISKVCGQPIDDNPVAEIGWHPCYRSANPIAGQWLQSLPDPFPMFHWHYQRFATPPGAELIFSSRHCENQAYVLGGNVLAMQCHVEMTTAMVESWMQHWGDELINANASEQTAEQILDHLEENIHGLHQVAETLYARWLETLQL